VLDGSVWEKPPDPAYWEYSYQRRQIMLSGEVEIDTSHWIKN
jgi:hypothetical protein